MGDFIHACWHWIVVNWTVNYTIAFATSVYSFFAILQWCASEKALTKPKVLSKPRIDKQKPPKPKLLILKRPSARPR